jgi:hypothetical protein
MPLAFKLAFITTLGLTMGCQNLEPNNWFAQLPNRAAIAQQLPANIQLDTVVEASFDGRSKVTVEDRLVQVGAKLDAQGKLQDKAGNPIEFFALTGCWGNPPINYAEVLGEQDRQLAELRRTKTVITLTCNPGGIPIP